MNVVFYEREAQVSKSTDDKIVLSDSASYELVTGEVTKDGLFLMAEEGNDSVSVGWWDDTYEEWTNETKQACYEVGKLTPIAKIAWVIPHRENKLCKNRKT